MTVTPLRQDLLDLAWDDGVTQAMIDEAVREGDGWESLGACSKLDDPDVMFPEEKGKASVAPSKKVCGKCPQLVRDTCLRERGDELYGTIGGRTEWERKEDRQRELSRLRAQAFRERQAAARAEAATHPRSA